MYSPFLNGVQETDGSCGSQEMARGQMVLERNILIEQVPWKEEFSNAARHSILNAIITKALIHGSWLS